MRDQRVRTATFKKHVLETWSPAPGRYEGRVVCGPTDGQHNTVFGYKRSSVLLVLKDSVKKALLS